jgi:hypothetical protein
MFVILKDVAERRWIVSDVSGQRIGPTFKGQSLKSRMLMVFLHNTVQMSSFTGFLTTAIQR